MPMLPMPMPMPTAHGHGSVTHAACTHTGKWGKWTGGGGCCRHRPDRHGWPVCPLPFPPQHTRPPWLHNHSFSPLVGSSPPLTFTHTYCAAAAREVRTREGAGDHNNVVRTNAETSWPASTLAHVLSRSPWSCVYTRAGWLAGWLQCLRHSTQPAPQKGPVIEASQVNFSLFLRRLEA